MINRILFVQKITGNILSLVRQLNVPSIACRILAYFKYGFHSFDVSDRLMNDGAAHFVDDSQVGAGLDEKTYRFRAAVMSSE